MGDKTAADVSESGNVIVGRENRQQVVNLGERLDRGDADHIQTIRLFNENMINERKERREEIKEMEHRLLEHIDKSIAMQTAYLKEAIAKSTASNAMTWVHRSVFVLAFLCLFAPVPLFYSQVRDFIGVTWQLSLSFAFVCYAFSAGLWSYMWWGE